MGSICLHCLNLHLVFTNEKGAWIELCDHKTRPFGALLNKVSLFSDNQLRPQWIFWAINWKIYFVTTGLGPSWLFADSRGRFVFLPQLIAICVTKLQKILSWWCRRKLLVVEGEQVKITAPNYSFAKILHTFFESTANAWLCACAPDVIFPALLLGE